MVFCVTVVVYMVLYGCTVLCGTVRVYGVVWDCVCVYGVVCVYAWCCVYVYTVLCGTVRVYGVVCTKLQETTRGTATPLGFLDGQLMQCETPMKVCLALSDI